MEATNDECAICLDALEMDGEQLVQLPNCIHVFHDRCIIKWKHYGGTQCPKCRSSLSTEALERVQERQIELSMEYVGGVQETQEQRSWMTRVHE